MDKSIVDIKIITLNRIIKQLRYKPLQNRIEIEIEKKKKGLFN
jgi:hypothetical protein